MFKEGSNNIELGKIGVGLFLFVNITIYFITKFHHLKSLTSTLMSLMQHGRMVFLN